MLALLVGLESWIVEVDNLHLGQAEICIASCPMEEGEVSCAVGYAVPAGVEN